MSGWAIRWGALTPPRVLSLFTDASGSRLRLGHRAAQIFWQAGALAIAYYVGARVGFMFRAPGVPQSVLWLPNSILLAAALMTPAREWPLLFLAAFPAHLAVAVQNQAPIGTMSMLYLTNCLDAVAGAAVVRAATHGRWRLDSLGNLIVFLAFGATVGPLFVSFLDAGITTLTAWAPSYWPAYSTRLRANTLTHVIVVPMIVGALSAGIGEWRHKSVARFAEGSVLIVVLVVTSTFVFARPFHADIAAFFYLPLPLLLWAAVRFGPATTGTALLTVAFVSSWSAVRGIGAFSAISPQSTIKALQLFLLCLSVPLLCLAMVIKERELAAQELTKSRNAVRVSIETVRDLAGRLIATHEVERARVARDLHDSVGQFVAEMAITMSAMRRTPAVRGAGLEGDFQRLYDQTNSLFENIRELSHELHPSILRHSGLAVAIQSLCTGFAHRTHMNVRCEVGEIEPISEDIALCVYRVTQEALRNAATHSGGHNVDVRLGRQRGELSLDVQDDGRGFDTVVAHARRGLGLVTMDERVRIVHGRLGIEAGPTGSRISARIPLPALT